LLVRLPLYVLLICSLFTFTVVTVRLPVYGCVCVTFCAVVTLRTRYVTYALRLRWLFTFTFGCLPRYVAVPVVVAFGWLVLPVRLPVYAFTVTLRLVYVGVVVGWCCWLRLLLHTLFCLFYRFVCLRTLVDVWLITLFPFVWLIVRLRYVPVVVRYPLRLLLLRSLYTFTLCLRYVAVGLLLRCYVAVAGCCYIYFTCCLPVPVDWFVRLLPVVTLRLLRLVVFRSRCYTLLLVSWLLLHVVCYRCCYVVVHGYGSVAVVVRYVVYCYVVWFLRCYAAVTLFVWLRYVCCCV